MPQWWTDRAKHIREENPEMPEGMEWALATEQYKKEFGHPPRRHKSKTKGSVMFIEQLIKLADHLDEKGLIEEANALDKIAPLLPSLPRKPRKRFDPMENPLPSKVKEVIDNPIFLAAVRGDDFESAKDVALGIIMESGIKEEDKRRIAYNIDKIEEEGASAKRLQQYLYNSWLKYIGLGVVGEQFVEQLTKLADRLDEKGLVEEANKIDSIVKEAWFSTEEWQRMREPRRRLSLDKVTPPKETKKEEEEEVKKEEVTD